MARGLLLHTRAELKVQIGRQLIKAAQASCAGLEKICKTQPGGYGKANLVACLLLIYRQAEVRQAISQLAYLKIRSN